MGGSSLSQYLAEGDDRVKVAVFGDLRVDLAKTDEDGSLALLSAKRHAGDLLLHLLFHGCVDPLLVLDLDERGRKT